MRYEIPDASRHSRPGVRTKRKIAVSQPGQRRTMPMAWPYSRRAPISRVVPHPAHVATAVVISCAKISRKAPAAAFPSRRSSSICMVFPLSQSASWSEAFGAHARWIVTELHEQRGHRLDERRGATDVCTWHGRRWPAHRLDHRAIDPAAVAAPVCGCLAGQRDRDVHAKALGGPFDLLPVDD